MAQKYRLIKEAANLLFPPKCSSCGKLLDRFGGNEWESAFCSSCQKLWVSEERETCDFCGLPVSRCACVTDWMRKADVDAFYKLVYYTPGSEHLVQNRLIYRLKKNRDRRAPASLTERWLEAIDTWMERHALSPEQMIVSYIPRGRKARAKYGTDQAKALAYALSKHASIPMRTCFLHRFGKNKSQKKQTVGARMKNAKESYSLHPRAELSGKYLLLVDDLVTTGASMAVCTRLAKQAGAVQVIALAIASDFVNRSPMGQNSKKK